MVIPWICFAKRSINWRRNLNNAGSCWTLSGMRTASTLYASWWICRLMAALYWRLSSRRIIRAAIPWYEKDHKGVTWERRKTFNTVTEHKTTGNTKTHIQRFELIRPGQFYFDACYNPSKTAFLKNAEKKGCKILNGLGMSSSRGLLRSNYGPDRRLHWMWCEKN